MREDNFHGSVLECIAYLSNRKDGQFEVKPYKEKRSLSANGYYWKLVELITAERRKDDPQATKEETHRLLMQDYGAWEKNDDGELITATFIEGKPSKSGYYSRPVAFVKMIGENSGRERGEVRVVVKGSHEYTVSEMNDLLRGTINEAQQLGIQTLTPQEVELMLQQMKGQENGG